MHPIAKGFIIIGSLLIIIGLLWNLTQGKIPLGKLPGDVYIEKEGMKIFIPITSSILVSILLSVIAYLFRKW